MPPKAPRGPTGQCLQCERGTLFGGVPRVLRPPENLAFLAIMGQILAYLIHLVPCPTNKTMRTRSLIEHTDMCVPDLLVKIVRMFGPRTAIFAPKYAFLGTKRPCRFIWCPVGWWLWRAGCILQDTYLHYSID